MVYELFYTDDAQRDLDKLEKSLVVRILKKLDCFISLPNPLSQAKQLVGFDMPTYRFRVGDYRIIFRKDVKTNVMVVLVVLKVAHRKGVYHSV